MLGVPIEGSAGMDGGPEVDRQAERAKVLSDLGFSIGLAGAALILVVTPLVFDWGLTGRTLLFVLALLVASVGVFNLLNDLGRLAGRPSLGEFGTAVAMVTMALIPVVIRNGYGINGIPGGILIAVALAVIVLAVTIAGSGLGKLAAERAGAAPQPAAPQPATPPSATPASSSALTAAVPRSESRPLSRDTKLTIAVTIFVGVLTAAATLIAPLLE